MSGKEMATMTNEGLAIEIKNLSVQIADLKATLAANNANFVSNEVFDLRMQQLEARMDILKADLKDLRRSRWVQNTLSAIFGAVLSLLVAFFFQNLGK